MEQEKTMNWARVIHLADHVSPAAQKVEKTEEEWKNILSEEQFYVMRKAGTERAFSSDLCSLFTPGLYSCLCCKTLLFDANKKFESGSGWPSFTAPLAENAIAYHKDTSFGMTRVEVICNVCDAHLGHVFPDGPAPTGLRFCINAVSLEKVKE